VLRITCQLRSFHAVSSSSSYANTISTSTNPGSSLHSLPTPPLPAPHPLTAPPQSSATTPTPSITIIIAGITKRPGSKPAPAVSTATPGSAPRAAASSAISFSRAWARWEEPWLARVRGHLYDKDRERRESVRAMEKRSRWRRRVNE